ncbi:hypothetical protein [Radiobacillus sp. PE A8.2]|uniref:hypothetical protein n=1 Tax=Radiobacillus sp. PE A8.2 TaxID=3380349 RepID=UPI0038904CD2
MRKASFGLILLLLLISCSQQQVEQSNEENAQSEKQPSLTIEDTDEVIENEELYIEISQNNEKVKLNLTNIPILNNYLKASPDTQKAINSISVSPIEATELISLYLLEFSCSNSRCSYILLDQSDESRSYLLADLAELDTISASPSQDKLMFVFKRMKQTKVETAIFNKLVIMDIVNWKTLPFTSTLPNSLTKYTSPILTTYWKDDQSILVTVPDVIEPNVDSIVSWELSSDMNTITTELSIKE